MPGGPDGDRAAATLLALLAFLAEGHTLLQGAFRAHVGRMVNFLESGILDRLDARKQRIARRVLDAARERQRAPAGDWLTPAREVLAGKASWRALGTL